MTGSTLMLLLAALGQDRSDVPIEVLPKEPAASRIVLLAGAFSKGGGEHEYFAGSALLLNLLSRIPGVAPILAAGGWPRNEGVFRNCRAVVFYMDGGGKQPYLTPTRLDLLEKLAAGGVGLVHLHQVIDYPEINSDRMLPLLGGVWVARGGARGHWEGVFNSFIDHPITRGVGSFRENDGFLYKLRFVDGLRGITPLLRTSPPATQLGENENIVSWAYQRPQGGRSFVFTGCHLHRSWGLESMRRFVLNGILWSAGLEVPAQGEPAMLDPKDLERHLDPVPPGK